jgi:beta-lactam-binding protein with PASTA domain
MGVITAPFVPSVEGVDPTVRLVDRVTPPTAIMADIAEHRGSARHRRALRAKWIVSPLLAALILVLLLVFLPSSGISDVVVPNLSGAHSRQAISELDRAGLHTRDKSIDGNEPAGLVESQQPTAGKRVPKGTTVDLGISSGFVDLTALRFLGEPYAEAASGLTSMGLSPSETDVISSSPTGTVLSINPAGRLKLGTHVSVQVAASAPPAPPPITHGHGHGHGHGNGNGNNQ